VIIGHVAAPRRRDEARRDRFVGLDGKGRRPAGRTAHRPRTDPRGWIGFARLVSAGGPKRSGGGAPPPATSAGA